MRRSVFGRMMVLLATVGMLWCAGAKGANTAIFVKIDTTTSGNWHDGTGNNKVYGNAGYWTIQAAAPNTWKNLPSYASGVTYGVTPCWTVSSSPEGPSDPGRVST